jgi:adenosine deaminase
MSMTEDIRTMPKVELHRHLELCFRHRTLVEVGPTIGIEVPADPELFRRDWQITEPMVNLEKALAKFANVQSVWGSTEIIERLTFEAVEDAAAQGIRIVELRYAPTFVTHGHPSLDFDSVHGAVLRGLERALPLPITVGLIGIIQKILSDEETASVADFIIANSDTFVGMDLADREIGYEIRRFKPHIERARAAGLHITIHAGEDDVPEAARHVRVAIEELGAERIGHGIHIVRDPEVLELAAASGVCFEVCPTSNWLTSAAPSIAEHPISRMIAAGVEVCVNTDDPGIMDVDLCEEYQHLVEHQGFDLATLERCNDVAARHSFIPIEDKLKAWPRPISVP